MYKPIDTPCTLKIHRWSKFSCTPPPPPFFCRCAFRILTYAHTHTLTHNQICIYPSRVYASINQRPSQKRTRAKRSRSQHCRRRQQTLRHEGTQGLLPHDPVVVRVCLSDFTTLARLPHPPSSAAAPFEFLRTHTHRHIYIYIRASTPTAAHTNRYTYVLGLTRRCIYIHI